MQPWMNSGQAGTPDRPRRGSFGQQSPELGVVPAQFVAGAIPMRADGVAKSPDFRQQLLAGQGIEVFIHFCLLPLIEGSGGGAAHMAV